MVASADNSSRATTSFSGVRIQAVETRIGQVFLLTHDIAIIYTYRHPGSLLLHRHAGKFSETGGPTALVLLSSRRDCNRLADVLGLADLFEASKGKSFRQRRLFDRTTIPWVDHANSPGNRKNGHRVDQNLVRIRREHGLFDC